MRSARHESDVSEQYSHGYWDMYRSYGSVDFRCSTSSGVKTRLNAIILVG